VFGRTGFAPDFVPQHDGRSDLVPVLEPCTKGADLVYVPGVSLVQIAQHAFALFLREESLEQAPR
jgi:hypothetical protein